MARRQKNQDTSEAVENSKSVSSKIITFIIGLIIILIWLAIFAVGIKLDVGGFASSSLRPLVKDIPVINRILPSVSDEQIAHENDYPYKSLKEAINRIKELELINDSLTKDDNDSGAKIKELEAEVLRLKTFEANQVGFEQRVLEFEKNVVFAEAAPSVEEYKQYYEAINPTNAEIIYKQVIEQIQYSKAIIEKADIYRKMKPANAAAILENMTADIDLVSQMLLCMRPTESSAILAKMDKMAAAKITKKMFDLDATRLNSVSE